MVGELVASFAETVLGAGPRLARRDDETGRDGRDRRWVRTESRLDVQ